MQLTTPRSLSNEFRDILDELENSDSNYFITGKAGTGKSTLLNVYKRTSKQNIVILAPTGIAALNVGGQTIHSFFGFPPKLLSGQDVNKRKNHRLYKKIQTLIIDEISMVRADLLDAIDQMLRINREIDEPYGGVRVIFFGDLFQLPPVIASPYERQYLKQRYESPYFFSSNVFKSDEKVHVIELNTVYRQEERGFVRLLDNIRTQEFDQDDLDSINTAYTQSEHNEDLCITLCSTNAIAKAKNDKGISQLQSEQRFYNGKVTGNFKTSLYPTDLALHLKVGAQVMFVKNDPQKRFVNGTIGKILHLEAEHIVVDKRGNGDKSDLVECHPMEWEILRYAMDKENPNKFKTETVGTFTQLPIKLAWGITIHKSQGKTFDRVHIDLGRGAFDYGQTYVALSRCRTLDGISLARPLKPKDIFVDQRIHSFYTSLKRYL